MAVSISVGETYTAAKANTAADAKYPFVKVKADGKDKKEIIIFLTEPSDINDGDTFKVTGISSVKYGARKWQDRWNDYVSVNGTAVRVASADSKLNDLASGFSGAVHFSDMPDELDLPF